MSGRPQHPPTTFSKACSERRVMEDKRNIFVDIGIALSIVALLVVLCLLTGKGPEVMQ